MNMAKNPRRTTAIFQKELTIIQYILLIMWTAHNCRHLPMSAVIASKTTSKISNNVPALFLFGDSIVDTGNNNRLLTVARADFSPYGENFVDHAATGRFSDGLILGDYIATYLGLPFVPPYLDSGENIMQGVCFASSASGILDTTGDKFGEHIALSQQVEYFRQVKGMVSAKLGDDEQATAFLSRSLHLIVTGSNDFFSNYDQDTGLPPSFQADLLSNFLSHLQEIYEVGARKIVIVSVPPLGCVPTVRYRRRPEGECDAALNAAIRSFNSAVLSAISSSTDFPGAHILYANAFDLALELLNNPADYGLKDGTTACCGWGQFGAAAPCLPQLDELCSDPSNHVFWDRVHPTSAAYRIIAQHFWNSDSPGDITPINIRQLSLLPF